MKHGFRFAVNVLLWLLCLSPLARGQVTITTITPTPDTQCAGNTGTYSVVPTAHVSYTWTVSSVGTFSSSPYIPTVTIYWGAVGTGYITVVGKDTLGNIVEEGYDTIQVEPLPVPVITANIRVGCQNLVDSLQAHEHVDPHILDDSHGCIKVCEGSLVTYTGHGFPGDRFGWTIIGGVIVAHGADTCMVRWGYPGGGSVTVHDTSIHGCVGTKTICIDIVPKPNAHFYAMPDSTSVYDTVCLGGSITFIENSVDSVGSPIMSHRWDFGDGHTFTTSSRTSQTHPFGHVGLDTVTLVVTNACGCTDTFRMYINVLPDSGVHIECPGVVCDGAHAHYCLSPATTPCALYDWSIRGGHITSIMPYGPCVDVIWDNVDTTGFGYLIFDARTCGITCTSPTVIKIPVIQHIGHISGPKVVCTEAQYLYAMPEWPSTVFTWTITGTTSSTLWNNDQNNQIVLWAHGTGVVYLRCDYYNTFLGCHGYALDTILVLPPDSIDGPHKVCQYGHAHYSLGAPGIGDWTITDPHGIVTPGIGMGTFTPPVFSYVGTYTLTVVPHPGSPFQFCPIPPFYITVDTLPPVPDSLLGPDTVCFGTPTRFTAKFPTPGTIFEWAATTGSCNFPDGDHTDATFTGGSPATITVWRVIKDTLHCRSLPLSKLVYRPNVPHGIYGPISVCPNTIYTYSAFYPFGETYDWTVNSNLKGSVQVNGSSTAQILFNNTSGPVDIILAMRKCDTVYHDTLHVNIISVPVITLSVNPNPVCLHALATLSVWPAGTTWTSYTVDWGDGPPTALLTHKYTTPITGNTTYNIVATFHGVNGCTSDVRAATTVTVMPAPVAFISPEGPLTFCSPFSYPLTATLTSGFGITYSLGWHQLSGVGIPGGGPCISPFPCNPVSITLPGYYYVVAIGTNGCADTSNIVEIDTSCGSSTSSGCTLNPTPVALIDTVDTMCGYVHLHGDYSPHAGLTFITGWWDYPGTALGVSTTTTALDCHFSTAGIYTFTYHVRLADTHGDTCDVSVTDNILVRFIAGLDYSVVCGTTDYIVTWLDISNYYPGYPPTRHSWYLDRIYHGYTSGTVGTWTEHLAPGDYELGQWVYYSSVDSCWVSDSVHLPAMPVAAFSFYRLYTCEKYASVLFTNLSTPSTGLSYLWDFNDGSGNTQPNPFKVYDGFGTYHVSLTVTNSIGCASTAYQWVTIVPMDLGGRLTGDTIVCAGSIASLTYVPTFGTAMPDTFFWIAGITPLYTTYTPSISVYASGSYWAHVTDLFGCYFNTPTIPVNIIQVPPAVISGPHDVCWNEPYTLDGWAGDDLSIGYKWFRVGTVGPIGPGSSYTDPALVAGTFVYYLVVSVPGPPGTFCTDTSAYDTVTVHPLPPPPVITDTMEDCNTYTIKLTATDAVSGYFNWSNGDAGTPIYINVGGPYRCWFTDIYGCQSHTDKFIEKDPKEFLWTFPAGCYDFCSDSFPRYIVGPIQPLKHWDYQWAYGGPIILHDSWSPSPVATFTVTGPGDYEMVLQNDYDCIDTTGVLDISAHNCDSCKCISFKGIYSYNEPCPPPAPPGCCVHKIVMCITNSCDVRITATVTATSGTLTPSVIVIPWMGTVCDTFVYTPPPGPFTGGWVYISVSWRDALGSYTCRDSVYVKPCGGKGGPGGKERQTISGTDGDASLSLVPNPAQNSTRVYWSLSNPANTGAIEVYDVAGRLMRTYDAKAEEGNWEMQLDNFAGGVYIVVLKENGKIMKQLRLSVIR